MASGRAADAGTDALPLYADAAVIAGTVTAGTTWHLALGAGRGAYLVPASGAVTVGGIAVPTRAGAAIAGEESVEIVATEDSELVLVEVAA